MEVQGMHRTIVTTNLTQRFVYLYKYTHSIGFLRIIIHWLLIIITDVVKVTSGLLHGRVTSRQIAFYVSLDYTRTFVASFARTE